jgi:hypothetical protein
MPPNGPALSPDSTDLMFPNQVVVESWIPLQAGPILFAALINFVMQPTKRVHAEIEIIKN